MDFVWWDERVLCVTKQVESTKPKRAIKEPKPKLITEPNILDYSDNAQCHYFASQCGFDM